MTLGRLLVVVLFGVTPVSADTGIVWYQPDGTTILYLLEQSDDDGATWRVANSTSQVSTDQGKTWANISPVPPGALEGGPCIVGPPLQCAIQVTNVTPTSRLRISPVLRDAPDQVGPPVYLQLDIP
jgi:hypothetical protein